MTKIIVLYIVIIMDTVSFKASHIKNVTISKKLYEKYRPCDVSLVKMDTNNSKDVAAIYHTADEWLTSFTAFTYEDMQKVITNRLLRDDVHIYALTTQKNNFQNINPKKILGVAEVMTTEDKYNKLEVLQTNPDYAKNVNDIENPKYKYIGSSLLNYVKGAHTDKDIFVTSVESAVKFYEKYGFQKLPKSNSLIYKAPKKNDIYV